MPAPIRGSLRHMWFSKLLFFFLLLFKVEKLRIVPQVGKLRQSVGSSNAAWTAQYLKQQHLPQRKTKQTVPPLPQKGEPSGLSLPSEKGKLTEGLLSRSEWPRGRVRPPPAHRMSFRPAGVQPPRSSGMRRKMKHLTNHTVELPHPSQEWTSLLWGFDSVSPQGGRVEMGAFQSLWPVAFSDR